MRLYLRLVTLVCIAIASNSKPKNMAHPDTQFWNPIFIESQQEEKSVLKNKTREELQGALFKFIKEKNLPMIEEIEKLNPQLLTESFDWYATGQKPQPPIVLALDCPIIKYLAEQHKKQNVPLRQADIEFLIYLTPLSKLDDLKNALECWKQLNLNLTINTSAMIEAKKREIYE